MDLENRIIGCIQGGAVGDALGSAGEGREVSLSDDTQLTLATCEAIEAAGGVSPEAIAAAFVRWFRAGAITGIGSSTLKALRDLAAGAHWALAGARGERTAGNGAAMRIAPLAFVLDPFAPGHRVVVQDVCRITHHNDEAYLGALAVLIALHAEAWPPGPSFFSGLAETLPDSRVRDRLIEFAEVSPEAPVREVVERFGASGYVVETVPLALFLARRMTGETFGGVLAELVEAGGDTDTIGSIAGQVAGAHLGASRLPPALLSLDPVQEVLAPAQAFARAVAGLRSSMGGGASNLS
jgi:ADP-ribosyl-[dinitrogen reductase] hydrolase